MYAFFEVDDKETCDKGDDTIIKTHTSIQSLSWMNRTNSFPNSAGGGSSGGASTSSQANASQELNDLDHTRSNGLKFKKFLNQQVCAFSF